MLDHEAHPLRREVDFAALEARAEEESLLNYHHPSEANPETSMRTEARQVPQWMLPDDGA